MTAPTPDIPVRAQVMGIRSMATFHRTNKIDLPLADVFDSHADIISTLGESLAAVTAERDQERAQHEATKSTLDKAWDDLRQARQNLADAPHGDDCPTMSGDVYDCDCWKAGL